MRHPSFQTLDKHAQSPLGGPSNDINVEMGGNPSTGEFTLSATSFEEGDTTLGNLEVAEWVIVSMNIVDMSTAKMDTIKSELLRGACQAADNNNKSLLIPETSIEGKFKNFLNKFGFIRSKSGVLERRPGAALPYSVLS